MEQRVFDVVRLWPRGREGRGRSRLEELQFEFTKTFRGETKPLLKRGPVSPFHSPLFSLSLSLFIFSSLFSSSSLTLVVSPPLNERNENLRSREQPFPEKR